MMDPIINKKINKIIIDKRDEKTISKIKYFLGSNLGDETNVFMQKDFDFDKGFYKGKFKFINPLTKKIESGTPEEYGRKRIAAKLSELPLAEKVVLDLGAGNLNIMRELLAAPEDKNFRDLLFINVDISGPWEKSHSRKDSALETGVRRINDTLKDLIHFVNVQYDFNSGSWPFSTDSIDYIVSSMSIHHIDIKSRPKFMKNISKSLKHGGLFIIMDVFEKQNAGYTFTNAGKGGPGECRMARITINRFIDMLLDCGLQLDQNTLKLHDQNRDFQTDREGTIAVDELDLGLHVNKATWYLLTQKP